MKFINLIPMALQLARLAEGAVPLSGQGKQKLAFALDAAEQSYAMEEELRTSWKDKSKFLEAIAKAVNLAVSLLNAAGVFKKSAPATS